MEKIKNTFSLLRLNKHSTDSSDIMEHLPRLYEFAKKIYYGFGMRK